MQQQHLSNAAAAAADTISDGSTVQLVIKTGNIHQLNTISEFLENHESHNLACVDRKGLMLSML